MKKQNIGVVLMSLIMLLTSSCSPFTPKNPSDEDRELMAIAKKYYDCLDDAGLRVELSPNQNGFITIVEFSGYDSMMYRNSRGGGYYGDIDFSDPRVSDFLSSDSQEPELYLDGINYSDVYAFCLNESGYDEIRAAGPVEIDYELYRDQVIVNNLWADCVREHGFPGVADSRMPAKPGETEMPAVYLPVSMTIDQARRLGEDCPFEEVLHDVSLENSNTGVIPSPNISFDLAVLMDPNREPTDEEKVEIERLRGVYDALLDGMSS